MCNIRMFYVINFKQRYAKVWRCTSEKGIIVRFCWFGGFLYEVGLEGGLVLCVIL